MALAQVDRLEILVVIDNYADSMLASAPGVQRRATDKNGWLLSDTVLAEHGVCLLLTAWQGSKKAGLIFDTGFSPIAAPRNLKFLNESLDKDHGLVVISGCGHAGIVNTFRYARELTSGRPLYALLGGFHLPAPLFRPAIEPTLQAIMAENPKLVVPMHCTGIEAKARLRSKMGPIYVDSAVGTRFQLPF